MRLGDDDLKKKKYWLRGNDELFDVDVSVGKKPKPALGDDDLKTKRLWHVEVDVDSPDDRPLTDADHQEKKDEE